MNSPLRVLHLEDDVRDTELVQAALEAEGIHSELTRVETEQDFVAALKGGRFDFIVADYTLPSFDGVSALRIAQQHSPDVPFLFVSGTLGEDVAIEALKTGATDYVLKTRLGRLGPSVRRALGEAREKSERKRAEEALRDSEEKWKAAFEWNPTMYFMVDSAGTTLSVNAFGADQLGYKSSELIGQPVLNVFYEPDRDQVRKDIDNCFRNLGRTMRWEARKVRRDGKVIWVRETANALLLKNQPVLLVVCEDITDRKRAEKAARRSEKQLRDVFETIPAMAWSALPDGSVDFMNRAWQDYTGLSMDKALGRNSLDIIHPDDQARTRAEWESAVKNEQPLDTEVRLRRADGEYRSWFVRNVPLRDEHGNIVKWYGTAIDIEDRKRAEEAVHRSEKQLRDLIETIPAIVFAKRGDGSSEFVSRQWTEYSGLSGEQTAGDGWITALHPDDREQHLGKWQESWNKGEPFESEARHRDAHGNYRWLLVRAVPLRDDKGNILKWYGALTDIEDRKRAEALLAGEKRLLEMIATGVPLRDILNALCQTIEEQRPGTLASVLLLNSDGVHLNVAAGPGLPDQWTRQMEKLPIGPYAGSCGTAAYRGSPVIVSDIANDPLWDVPQHRASALEHGLQASWSSPVLSSRGNVLGTFCMYYREPRRPTSRDLALIELATHLARVAIERDRAEEALRTSEQLARSHVEVMMRSLDVLATEAAPEKFIAEMLRTIGQRMHARSVLLWLRDQMDDALRLHLMIEDDRQVAPDPDHPFVKEPQAWKGSPQFQEMFFTKGPVVSDDIEQDPRIDADLRDYLLKRGRKKFMAIPMFVLGEVRGFIGIQHTEGGAYRAEEVELAQALAHHVMMAVHEAELGEQRRHAVILEERTRMARDIHDTLAQGFTGVILQMDAAEEELLEQDPEHTLGHLRRARELARESLGEARRSVHALRPRALEKAAFADALKAIFTNTTAGTSLRTDFQLEGEPRNLEPAVEENLLHIGQEALSNALKHAHATIFQARLCFTSDAVRLELRDNGDGFVVDRLDSGGIGLIGMKERAEQIGATLTVSSELGAGTMILAMSPYQRLSR